MQYAAQNLIPSTTELGGKSPNIFFADVMDADDAFLDKAIEGLVLYAFNKGEVCTCPSRALIQESIYDEFMERCLERIARDHAGQPARPDDDDRAAGLDGAAREDRELRRDRPRRGRRAADRRRARRRSSGELAGGYYFEPTVLKGHNEMRVFQEEIFGPGARRHHVHGRGRGARDRQRHALRPRRRRLDARRRAARSAWAARSRPAACGRTATTSTRRTPPSAATRSPGVGRENHRMMLDHYSADQVPARVSYDPNPLGFF